LSMVPRWRPKRTPACRYCGFCAIRAEHAARYCRRGDRVIGCFFCCTAVEVGSWPIAAVPLHGVSTAGIEGTSDQMWFGQRSPPGRSRGGQCDGERVARQQEKWPHLVAGPSCCEASGEVGRVRKSLRQLARTIIAARLGFHNVPATRFCDLLASSASCKIAIRGSDLGGDKCRVPERRKREQRRKANEEARSDAADRCQSVKSLRGSPSPHSGGRMYGGGGWGSLFSVVPIGSSLRIISLRGSLPLGRWSPPLGRAAACQHMVPS
jgi:hypothetical protein